MSKTIKLVDKKARDIISTEIKTNLIVEAGAGSGKTSEMANRIVALISTRYRSIGEIVAITFTKKAANELQERVRKRLVSEYTKTNNKNIKEAIDNYHESFIGTIHSFCSKLIRERPIEAKVDPEFDEIDEIEDARIRQKVWEEYVYYASPDTQNLLKQIDEFLVKESTLKNFLKVVCDNQDVEFDFRNDELVKSYEEIDEVISETYILCEKKVKMLFNEMPSKLTLDSKDTDGLQKTILRFMKKIQNRDRLSMQEKLKLIKLFLTAKSIEVVQKKWAEDKEGRENAKSIKEAVKKFREVTILPALDVVNSYIYNTLLIPFVREAKGLYAKYKDRNSKLNFQDLLLKTANVLRDNPEVREYFQKKYKTFLVDEFQDTDPIQSQILMFLAGSDLKEKKWDRIYPKEGSLFVVGDPKQSIYAFRRADIEIYESFKQHIINTGGKCVELVTNFRTVEELGVWYNTVFDKIMNGDSKDLEDKNKTLSNINQAHFSSMSTINKSMKGTLCGIDYYKIDSDKTDIIVELDGSQISKIIKWLVNDKEITTSKIENGVISYSKRKVEYRDIMILSIKKRQLTTLSKIISKNGIPVKVAGADIMKKTPIFMVLANIIKMLAYPEENAYLHTVMIQKPFYFKREELVLFTMLGGHFNIHFNFTEFLKENDLDEDDKRVFEKIKDCFTLLKRFEDYAKNLPCGALVERIVEEIGLQRELIKSYEKVVELGSFTSLLEQIRLKDITDIWGLDKLVGEILRMIDLGAEDENDIEGGDYNAVRMMNVHKAKGLEAPIVILATPCSGEVPGENMFVQRQKRKNGGTRYYGHIKLNADSENNHAREYIKSDYWNDIVGSADYKAYLERERVLYVSATRARNMLIISKSAKVGKNPWESLLYSISSEDKDLMHKIYEEEKQNKSIETEFSEELTIPITDRICNINDKRNMAIKNNSPTFIQYNPSSQGKIVKGDTEFSEELTPDLTKLIVQNTITVEIGTRGSREENRLEIGEIVHRLFEAKLKGTENINEIINNIIEKTQVKGVTKDSLECIVKKFEESCLYKRIEQSEKVYTEVPISLKERVEGQDIYVNGQIDLVFKENDGWTIIDYKTCNSSQVKRDLFKEYFNQLLMYKKAWEHFTSCKNIKTELFFVEKL